MRASTFFSDEQKQLIVSAIEEAEKCTSGEIRLHVEMRCHGDVMKRAVRVFQKLKMQRTQLRNGVLFYMAVSDRQFAIIGDAGINEMVPKGFWNDIEAHMSEMFAQGCFTEGVTDGIRMVGKQLQRFFPYQPDDVNELSNEISYDDGEKETE